MKTRKINRGLPYKVTFTVNEKKVVRKFSNPQEAWKCLVDTNGILDFGFRVLNEV